ncbi:MAG: hypothetical protein WD267_02605 [Balneolales bacterium]
MDIFKLIFHHDLLLEQLSGNEDARNKTAPEMGLEDFMKPIPTYTKYYFSGTRLEENLFGLTILKKRNEVCKAIQNTLGDTQLWLGNGDMVESIEDALEANIGTVIVASNKKPSLNIQALEVDDGSGVRDRIDLLRTFLDDGSKVIYLEKAHNGTDLHLFSKENLYEPLFNNIKPLVSPDFRYFSMNAKRMTDERKFYFEMWALERPPHGIEEVSSESVI